MTVDDADARVVEGPDGTVEVGLPADLRSVRVARRWVAQRWDGLADDVLGDVELVVSELVANAVRHGRPSIVFRMRVDPFAVDVAVLDHGPELPPTEAPPMSVDGGSGRGLAIIDRLAGDWGVEPLTDGVGKVVWASLRRHGGVH